MESIILSYRNGEIEKEYFIKVMHENFHSKLFNFARYLSNTNIQKIEIDDGRVIMITRDRGIRIACEESDFRIAPIEALNFKDYERPETKMVEKLFSDGDTFFDIGANIGWYSLNVAAAHRNSKIFSFEPIPNTYKQLLKNIELNSRSLITPCNFGFSDQSGEFPFYYYPEGSGNASSANLTERQDIETVMCNVQTLDDFCTNKNEKVDFIKCDVEGAELLVFKGGIKTIQRDKPIVFSEILRKWSSKFNYNPNEIFKLFKSMGFESFTTNGGYLIPFDAMDDLTVETNFFFLNKEKHRRLIDQYSI